MKQVKSGRLLLSLVVLAGLSACDAFVDDATRVERAKEYAAAAEYRAAVIELKNVLRSSPGDTGVRVLLGEMLLQVGDVEAAVKELETARKNGAEADDYLVPLARAKLRLGEYSQVVALNPAEIYDTRGRADLIAVVGQAELARGNTVAAGRHFEDALELNPQQADALVGSARIAGERGELGEASDTLTRLLETAPNDHAALASLGRVQYEEGDYTNSEMSYKKALDAATAPGLMQERLTYMLGIIEAQIAVNDRTGALATADQMLKMSKEHPVALLHAARVDLLAGENDAAIEKSQRLIVMAPDYEPARLLLAGAAMAKGNHALAGSHLEAVVSSNPGNERARKLLAQVRMNQGSPEEALEVLAPLMAQDQGDAQLLAMVGTASIQTGREEEGVELLERGIAMDSKDPAILMQAASNFLAAGEIDRAIEVLEAMPGDAAVDQRDLLLILALLRKDDTVGARAKAQSILDSRPGDPKAHSLMGAFHLAVREFDSARRQFEKAIDIDPNAYVPIVNLARIDVEEGKLDDAEKRFESFLERRPGNVTALIALAQLAERRGDEERSLGLLEQAREANPDEPGPPIILGNYYMRKGNLALAGERAAQAVRAAPGNGQAHTLQGLVLLQSDRASEALQSLNRAIEVSPKMPQAHFLHGRAQEMLGAFDAAYESYENAYELNEKLFPARAAMAGIAVRRSDFNKALQIVDGLVDDYPDRAEPLVLRGDIQVARGNLNAAGAAYESAAAIAPSGVLAAKRAEVRRRQGRDDALTVLEDWVDANPGDAESRTILGRGYLAADRSDAAVEQFKAVMEIAPSADVAATIAQISESQQQFGEAAKWIGRAAELEPDSVPIRIAQAKLQARLGELKSALKVARALRRENPDSVDIHTLEGDLLVANKDYKDAIAAYERAITIEPSEILTLRLYGARSRSGDSDAWRILSRWSEDHPGHLKVALQLAQYFQQNKRVDDAVATYRRVIGADSQNVVALNNLAYLYYERGREGDLSRGLEMAERAYNINPAPAVADTYGWLLLQDGQTADALGILEQAASKSEMPEIQYHYAVALARNGKAADARDLLDRLLASSKDFDGREEAQKLRRDL